MSDTLAREDLEALRHFAELPCECPEGMETVKDEVPGAACGPCRARKWLRDGKKLVEELS